MRNLILSTFAAVSIAAIPAFAGAQQQTGADSNQGATASGGPSSNAGDRPDHSAPASSDWSTKDSTASASGAAASSTTGAGAGFEYQGNATSQEVGAPPTTYPVCRGNIQDECINPRAAGKNWGNRPLSYWPGKPASE